MRTKHAASNAPSGRYHPEPSDRDPEKALSEGVLLPSADPVGPVNVAFYAPMKAPDHPTHSGDRLLANLFLQALKRAGHQPVVVSRFRSYEGRGDVGRQRRLRAVGERLAGRLVRRYLRLDARRRPDCWFTYHLYHKAPDWLGPRVSRALGIPYVVAEASVAPKQADGPWADGFAAAADAIADARLVVTLSGHDATCLRPVLSDASRLVRLKPFLDLSIFNGLSGDFASRARLAADIGAPPEVPWLITVAMMRAGDKLASYKVLADGLARLGENPWHLVIIGDGPARAEVESALAVVPGHRISFLGIRPRAELAVLLGACDLFVWPAVGEALGMAMLEAHAAGLPVVAGDSGGVAEIVSNGETGLLTAAGHAGEFATAVANLLTDARKRRQMGERARARAASAHGLDAASAALAGWLRGLTENAPSP